MINRSFQISPGRQKTSPPPGIKSKGRAIKIITRGSTLICHLTRCNGRIRLRLRRIKTFAGGAPGRYRSWDFPAKSSQPRLLSLGWEADPRRTCPLLRFYIIILLFFSRVNTQIMPIIFFAPGFQLVNYVKITLNPKLRT